MVLSSYYFPNITFVYHRTYTKSYIHATYTLLKADYDIELAAEALHNQLLAWEEGIRVAGHEKPQKDVERTGRKCKFPIQKQCRISVVQAEPKYPGRTSDRLV